MKPAKTSGLAKYFIMALALQSPVQMYAAEPVKQEKKQEKEQEQGQEQEQEQEQE